MFRMFKKAIWIVCEDITACPSVQKTHAEIAKYCEENGYSYNFTCDDEVIIEGVTHEICRGRSPFYRGCYVIKCREK